jgi:Asp/Glu/hydantoin racemase
MKRHAISRNSTEGTVESLNDTIHPAQNTAIRVFFASARPSDARIIIKENDA